MSKRYNPPPNWPAPPAGWTQPEGWQPDAAWGPPPPGHQLWTDDSRGAWFRRHKVITAIILVIALAGIVNLFVGDDQPAADAAALSAPLASKSPRAASASPSDSSSASEAEAAQKAAAEAAKKTAAETAKTEAAVAAKRAAADAKRQAVAAAKKKAAAKASRKAAALAERQAAASVYYENCSAVEAAGAAPIYRGDPGYGGHLDRDDDGVACEQ